MFTLTNSIPAHSSVFPAGTPSHLMTPYTVMPELDTTSTMDPISRDTWGVLGLWIWVTLCSVGFSLACRPRDPIFGIELMRVTAFLFRPVETFWRVGKLIVKKSYHIFLKACHKLPHQIDLQLTWQRSKSKVCRQLRVHNVQKCRSTWWIHCSAFQSNRTSCSSCVLGPLDQYHHLWSGVFKLSVSEFHSLIGGEGDR